VQPLAEALSELRGDLHGLGSLLFLYPVALVVLFILVLHCAPGDAVGAVFFTVLLLGGVEGLLVDLLGMLWQIVLDVVRKLRDLLVGHLSSFGSLGRGAGLSEEFLVAVA
jgi:hypothetical protein